MPKLGQKNATAATGGMSVEQIVQDCHSLGIVGEDDLLLAIYLVGTSRLLARPLSAIVRGKSSSGKSVIVHQVARLFPEDQVILATRMTPQALYHMEGVAHKFVVAGERNRVQDEAQGDATAALRQLLSERKIVKHITCAKKDGGFVTEKVEQEGPIAYVETTTLKTIFAEDLNRSLLLTTDDSERHTKAILARTAARYSGAGESDNVEAIIRRHHKFQSSLKSRKVTIPFASQVMNAMPTKKVEARRAGQQVLSMIEVVAFLHQFDRKPDAAGRIVATRDDYEIAARILRRPLGESLGVGAGAKTFYLKVAGSLKGKQFGTAEAQKLDKDANDRTIREWLSVLAGHGCIKQIQPGRGPKAATWMLTELTPDDAILPPFSRLVGEGGI